jgi:uncharacterized protein
LISSEPAPRISRGLRYNPSVPNELVSVISSANALDHASLKAKEQLLLDSLARLESVLVALSGGADSAYLAWAAHKALGHRALAITALSASFSAHDREQAEVFIHHTGLRHEFIQTNEFENPLYVANNADRCYHCKTELFTELDRLAIERHFSAVAYGVNADDASDFRPGHRAAFEHKVLAPLLDAGMRKAEIRELSHRAGLPTWDRPASACLSSRIPYGTPVTAATLSLVEKGEAILRELGFRQFRVRYHGELARIEIAPAELPRALTTEMAGILAEQFKALGFTYVTLDLEGYRQGALNAALKKN